LLTEAKKLPWIGMKKKKEQNAHEDWDDRLCLFLGLGFLDLDKNNNKMKKIEQKKRIKTKEKNIIK